MDADPCTLLARWCARWAAKAHHEGATERDLDLLVAVAATRTFDGEVAAVLVRHAEAMERLARARAQRHEAGDDARPSTLLALALAEELRARRSVVRRALFDEAPSAETPTEVFAGAARRLTPRSVPAALAAEDPIPASVRQGGTGERLGSERPGGASGGGQEP